MRHRCAGRVIYDELYGDQCQAWYYGAQHHWLIKQLRVRNSS